jgi:hypothetical protein
MEAPGMGMAETRTAAATKLKAPEMDTTAKMPMTAQQAEQDKMQKLENAWDKLVAEWTADGLTRPPKTARQPGDGAPLTLEEKMWARQRAEWEKVKAQTEAEWAREQGDQKVTYEDAGEGAPKKAAAAAEKRAAIARMHDEETSVDYSVGRAKGVAVATKMAATNSSIDIRPITIAVNNLNTTINKVLTAIESRLKKNDVNSQLKKMTEFISQINDSLPVQEGGGGYTPRKYEKA